MAVRGISHRPSPPDRNYPVSETPLLSVITITSPLQKNLQENSAVKYTAFLLTGMHLPVPKPKQIYSFMYYLSKGEKEIFKFQKKTTLKHYSIGICGCGHGCGVTHLSIALSNYCASKLRCSTACLELNQSQDFESLSGFTSKDTPFFKKESPHNMFTIYDVDYYPAVSIGEIPQF